MHWVSDINLGAGQFSHQMQVHIFIKSYAYKVHGRTEGQDDSSKLPNFVFWGLRNIVLSKFALQNE